MPPRVVLVGLPGSGKSTVGAELAGRLGMAFADSDELVEAQTGRPVSEIFRQQGELVFRQLEADMIAVALADFEGVLALGGGAVTTQSVRQDLASSGVPVMLLTAGQDQLLSRLAATEPRPLLAADPAAKLAELARNREPLYREVATATVQTDGRSVAAVTDELCAKLTGQPA